MKKAVLMIAALGFCSLQGIAQDKYVVSALTAAQGRNYDEAKEDIDKAMGNPETSQKPKALLAKAQIYMMLQNMDKYNKTEPYKEAATALFKLMEVKPDYEKSTVDGLFEGIAFLAFNEGVKKQNDKDYAKSSEAMKTVVKIHDLNGGKRAAGFPHAKIFDTAVTDAYVSLANSAMNADNYDEAATYLVKAKNTGMRKSPALYEQLIRIYRKKGSSADEYATIQEGRAAFPEDANLRNYELNYYINSGKQDELVKKLEDAVAKEPNNADLHFNLATSYLGMANPGGDKPKPANAADYTSKAEAEFKKATGLAPENAIFNYNFGVLYFNQATELNSQMNAITGSSAAETAKYDKLKAQRDGLFNNSLPYFEKAAAKLSSESSLTDDNKRTLKATYQALSSIYATQSKMDKVAELKKKQDELK